MIDSGILPEIGKKKKQESIGFSTEARILHRLGTESVSDQILSIVELIKNSYDAKATTVNIILENMKTGNSTITIEDDGNGMTIDEVRHGWLRLATSIKHSQRKKSSKRDLLGEKGIGRMAVENLSHKTTIISFPKNQTEGIVMEFNWDDYITNKDLEAIKNERSSFEKEKSIHGLKIKLNELRSRWTEDDVHRLYRTIKTMSPPTEEIDKFTVNIITDEYTDIPEIIDNNFLNKNAYQFKASLQKTGNCIFYLWKHGKKQPIKNKRYNFPTELRCGPIEFDLYFYYLEKRKMEEQFGVKIQNLNEYRRTLQHYGGIRIYRDKIRLSGFGGQDDDWLSLDKWSRNEPSVIPARNQIISSVKISSHYNPEINDTATRENIIKNESFQDMVEFLKHSIGVFGQMRAEIEQKRKSAPKNPDKYIDNIKKTITTNKDKKALLDMGKDYPYNSFYGKLEEEINLCYIASLPNATLMLSRKMIENLLYNILERKFPTKREIWYRTTKNGGRSHDFAVLLENLSKSTSFFNQDEISIIHKLATLIEPFRREANTNAHKVIDYIDTIDDLDKLKIDEIIDLEISLYQKVKQSTK